MEIRSALHDSFRMYIDDENHTSYTCVSYFYDFPTLTICMCVSHIQMLIENDRFASGVDINFLFIDLWRCCHRPSLRD